MVTSASCGGQSWATGAAGAGSTGAGGVNAGGVAGRDGATGWRTSGGKGRGRGSGTGVTR